MKPLKALFILAIGMIASTVSANPTPEKKQEIKIELNDAQLHEITISKQFDLEFVITSNGQNDFVQSYVVSQDDEEKEAFIGAIVAVKNDLKVPLTPQEQKSRCKGVVNWNNNHGTSGIACVTVTCGTKKSIVLVGWWFDSKGEFHTNPQSTPWSSCN